MDLVLVMKTGVEVFFARDTSPHNVGLEIEMALCPSFFTEEMERFGFCRGGVKGYRQIRKSKVWVIEERYPTALLFWEGIEKRLPRYPHVRVRGGMGGPKAGWQRIT